MYKVIIRPECEVDWAVPFLRPVAAYVESLINDGRLVNVGGCTSLASVAFRMEPEGVDFWRMAHCLFTIKWVEPEPKKSQYTVTVGGQLEKEFREWASENDITFNRIGGA